MAETVTATFNPTILFNLLVGAAGAAGRRNPGPILTSIRNDLRKEIESALPVIYLFDAEVIVDSMLAVLQPIAITADNKLQQQERLIELGRFVTQVGTDSGLETLPELKSKTVKGIATKVVIPGSPDAYAAFVTKYNEVLADRDNLIKLVRDSIVNAVSARIEVAEVTSSIANLHARLHSLVTEITSIGTPLNAAQNVKFTRVIRAAGRSIRNLSNKVRIVSDPESLIADYKASSQVLVYAQNFNAAKTGINQSITKELKEYLNANFSISVRDEATGFKAGNFAAAGHVGFVSDTLKGINTPQLQAASIILAQAGKDAPGLIDNFISKTEHTSWLINVKKDQGENVQKILSLGISLVRSQPSTFNSGVLAPQETALIDAEIRNQLDSSYRDALAYLQKQAATNDSFHQYLINVFRMSPTIVEGIELKVLEVLLGKKPAKRTGSKSGVHSAYKGSGKILPLGGSSSKLSSPKSKIQKPTRVPQKSNPKLTNTVNLASIQALINNNLAQQIRRNMGTGSARNVLNYRTGRLAESARVERLSQSREGLITAFYSYMRNPYGTFSQGGQQSKPQSRDPKLLLSKSIRELAAQQVTNRLRAVLV